MNAQMQRAPLLLILLSCLAASAERFPAPETLIRAAVAAQTAQRDWKFTYREDDDQFLIDKKNQRVPSPRKTFDVIMLEGESYRKLVLIGGKPIDDETQEQVNQDLEKERAKRRQQQKKSPTVTKYFNVSPAGIEQLEQLFDTKVIGEETVLGRKTWRLESVPKRNLRPADKEIDKEEVATAITRVVTWIDRQDGVEIKQTSTFASAFRDIHVGTELTVEFSKVGEAWLPGTFRARFDYKTGLMQHSFTESDGRRYDYKRFTADSRIVTP